MTMLTDTLDQHVACAGCDLLHARPRLQPGEQARCVRCGDLLATNKPHSVERVLAGAICGVVLIVVAVCLPFIGLVQSGVDSRISLLDAVFVLWDRKMLLLGLVVLASMVLLPFIRFLLLAIVFARIKAGYLATPFDRRAFHWSLVLEPWAMAEVFMVGVAVSLIKIATLAHLELGIAFWAVILLVADTVFVKLSLCRDTTWQILTRETVEQQPTTVAQTDAWVLDQAGSSQRSLR